MATGVVARRVFPPWTRGHRVSESPHPPKQHQNHGNRSIYLQCRSGCAVVAEPSTILKIRPRPLMHPDDYQTPRAPIVMEAIVTLARHSLEGRLRNLPSHQQPRAYISRGLGVSSKTNEYFQKYMRLYRRLNPGKVKIWSKHSNSKLQQETHGLGHIDECPSCGKPGALEAKIVRSSTGNNKYGPYCKVVHASRVQCYIGTSRRLPRNLRNRVTAGAKRW